MRDSRRKILLGEYRRCPLLCLQLNREIMVFHWGWTPIYLALCGYRGTSSRVCRVPVYEETGLFRSITFICLILPFSKAPFVSILKMRRVCSKDDVSLTSQSEDGKPKDDGESAENHNPWRSSTFGSGSHDPNPRIGP